MSAVYPNLLKFIKHDSLHTAFVKACEWDLVPYVPGIEQS